MNYYKQGSAARAEEIKTAFEKLGYNSRGLDFSCGFFYTVERDVHYCVSDYCIVSIIKTHPDYKELELPIEPCFKVGDNIRSKSTQMTYTIIKIDVVNRRYELDYCSVMDFKEQDKFELAPKPHYDIKNFHAGMPVLVRDYIYEEWRYVQFSHMRKLTHALAFNAGCQNWYQCIPFNEETKHLLGTTNMCPEEYINW